jgi:hypothetical protein
MENHFMVHAQKVLDWLLHSIAATTGKGSAAYCHLWRGWSPPYPETTGYIIETLYDFGHQFQRPDLRAAALHCARWLCQLQRPDGAFPGKVAKTDPRSFSIPGKSCSA